MFRNLKKNKNGVVATAAFFPYVLLSLFSVFKSRSTLELLYKTVHYKDNFGY